MIEVPLTGKKQTGLILEPLPSPCEGEERMQESGYVGKLRPCEGERERGVEALVEGSGLERN